MRLRDIPPIVRAAVSLTFVAAGVFLLYVTWFEGDGDGSASGAGDAARPACPTGWTDFDNSALRFKVCLPNNMVFSTGVSTVALNDVDQTDPRFVNDFHVVNLAWLNPWPETMPPDPAQPPLRIAIRVPPSDFGIEGCNLRAEPADSRGVQSCSDLFFVLDGLPFVDPAGDLHRFRALAPAVTPAGSKLYFQADSMTAAWTLQQPLVRQVLESIRPY